MPEFTGLSPHMVLMDHMEEMKVVLHKNMTETQKTLLIEIKTEFYQQNLGMDFLL